jgi:NTP pyrophosphatase (non-canonical NTP hydrolase)
MTVIKRNMDSPGDTAAHSTTPIYERIETNADLVKWCVHVLGADDVHPVRSHSEAVAVANELNQLVLRLVDSPDEILCFAYPLPWTHGDDKHEEALSHALEADELSAVPLLPSLTLETLRDANWARQLEWPGNEECDVAFRALEFAEEAGEVAGAIKKYLRAERGIAGTTMTLADIADEMGDALISLDLVAGMLGIDLGLATSRKFNATSEKVGLKTRLPERITTDTERG